MSRAISALIVGFDGPADGLSAIVSSLRRQTLAPSQFLCADQSPDGRFHRFFESDPGVDVLRIAENVGYSSACNRLARRATADYLLFINPDASAEPDCVLELVRALEEQPAAAIAGAQVLLPGSHLVNAGDNVLHLSGLSWSGRYGLVAEDGPPRPTAVASGAALLIRRHVFESLGGYTEGFFMYYDDVDLAWRARLAGWEVLFCPRARVTHEYEFLKGAYKWRYLERNRWWCLLAHLELGTLLALAPLLCLVELAILLRAASEGWLPAKLGGWRSLWASRSKLRRRRAEIQRLRRIPDTLIVQRMSASVDSPFLTSAAIRALDPVLRAYRVFVLVVTRWSRSGA